MSKPRPPPKDRMWGHRYVLPSSPPDRGRHAHEVGLLACLESGLLELESELGSWMIFPKTVTYVPPAFPHAVRASNEIVGWVLHLPLSQTDRLPDRPHVLEMSELLMSACRRIAAWDTAPPTTPAQSRLMEVAMDELAAARPGGSFELPLPRHAGLLAVARTILANADDTTKLDQLAKRAGMSRRSFTRHFALETGLSFSVWRKRTKLRTALQRLSEGASVTEVALGLGYRSTSAFITMFRHHVGSSPARYVRKSSRAR